jgi:hypothetical protein
MKVAIMQPYFFPYLGYFGLIKNSDRFIICDVVQFMRHGWIERNRILKPEMGWHYIRVPLVKHSHKATISEVKIRAQESWQDRIFQQLEYYKKRSPYYKEVIGFLQNAFRYQTDNITDLNAHLLAETCQYIGIPFRKEIFSEMDVMIEKINTSDDWAINICQALAAETYINPPGGIEIYKRDNFTQSGLKLEFLKVNLRSYNQGRDPFEEALSIIDVMMFNAPKEIRSMLDDYRLL